MYHDDDIFDEDSGQSETIMLFETRTHSNVGVWACGNGESSYLQILCFCDSNQLEI